MKWGIRIPRAGEDQSASIPEERTSKLGRNNFAHSLWPCLGKGVSLGGEAVLADSGLQGDIVARVGRVRSLDFLSILLPLWGKIKETFWL
jgi:hypothetical protein